MVKFIVKKTFWELMDSFVVLDKFRKVLYRAKSKRNILNKEFFLYDVSDNLQARISKELDQTHLFYHIEVDGKKVATITTNKGFTTKEFTVEPQEMVTKHNRSKLVCTLIQNGKPVGTVRTKLFRFKKTYTVRIEEPSEALMFIMFALTMFIDERDPSFFGSIFKKMDWF